MSLPRPDVLCLKNVVRASLLLITSLGFAACSDGEVAPPAMQPTEQATTVPEIDSHRNHWGLETVDTALNAAVECEANDEYRRYRPWYIDPGVTDYLVEVTALPFSSTAAEVTRGWTVRASEDGSEYEVYGTTGERRTAADGLIEVKYTYIGTIPHTEGETSSFVIDDLSLEFTPVSQLADVRKETEFGYFGGVYSLMFEADPEKPGLYAELHCSGPQETEQGSEIEEVHYNRA